MTTRRIDISCAGGDGTTHLRHPKRHIATLTDTRRPVADRETFLTQTAASLAAHNSDIPPSAEEHRKLALAMYDQATRIGYVEEKTRPLHRGGLHESVHHGLFVEETRRGRYFHFVCDAGAPLRVHWIEAHVTKFVDTLLGAGLREADLFAMRRLF